MKSTAVIGAMCLALAYGLTVACLDRSATDSSGDKTSASPDNRLSEEQIRKLLSKAQDLGDEGEYVKALEMVRPLVEQAGRFPDKADFQYEILDYQHFLLLKIGAYRDALQCGFAIEELGRKIGDRKSPWDCLKIADAYLGLEEYDKALDWIEKAVKERNFTKLDVLQQGEGFAPLRGSPRFKALLADIEKSLGIGQPARDFRITLLDGTPFVLSEQKGKVVLIDFWDARCVPCRRAMPHLKELHQKYAARGLEIIGISLDSDRRLLEDYLQEVEPSWKMACSFKGWNDGTAVLYRINATPSTWLIDRYGILRSIDLRGDDLTQAIVGLL